MSDLVLSASDMKRLHEAMHALLTPLRHEHPDSWRAEVNERVRALLGADKASFQLPAADIGFLYSREVDMDALGRYLPIVNELDPSGETMRRTTEFGVCNRKLMWGDLDAFQTSAYYNEFIVPLRAFDMLCASVRLEGAERPAILYLHHDSPRRTLFGKRGLDLLGLLRPAFVAGVRAFHRFHRHRESLFQVVDAVDAPALVFDEGLSLRHRSTGYRRLELSEAEDTRLMRASRELAGTLEALWSARVARALTRLPRASRRVRMDATEVELEASLVDGSGGAPLVLVHIKRAGARSNGATNGASTSPAEVHASFDLTPRESEVADLLALRRTNREIADELGISEHTARHHTERVLAKLNVNSRREVAEKLGSS